MAESQFEMQFDTSDDLGQQPSEEALSALIADDDAIDEVDGGPPVEDDDSVDAGVGAILSEDENHSQVSFKIWGLWDALICENMLTSSNNATFISLRQDTSGWRTCLDVEHVFDFCRVLKSFASKMLSTPKTLPASRIVFDVINALASKCCSTSNISSTSNVFLACVGFRPLSTTKTCFRRPAKLRL